jgi:hypothetical protein
MQIKDDGGRRFAMRRRDYPMRPQSVDTNELILHALVHEANIQDHNGGKLLLEPFKGLFP